MNQPLFSPDEITVDETIDYVASLRERILTFVPTFPNPDTVRIEARVELVATGTDDARSGC